MSGSPFDRLSLDIAELIFEGTLWDGLQSFRGAHSNGPFGPDCPEYIKTLASCRLVNKAFNALAYPRLFHTVQLTRPGSYVCNVGGELAAQRAQGFLSLIRRNPEIGIAVQAFSIHSTGGNQLTRMWFKNDPSIKEILPRLPNVKDFAIKVYGGNLSWTKLSKSMAQAFEKFCLGPSITRLEFQKIQQLPLTTCILQSKTLEDLGLYGVDYDSKVDRTAQDSTTAPRIKTLQLCTRSMSRVIMGIADGHPRQWQTLSALEKLDIALGGQYHEDPRSDFENGHLSKIINNCSGTLKELVLGDTLEILIPGRQWPSQRCLSLAKCLERIVLRIPAYLIYGGPSSVPDGFLNFLNCKEALNTVRTIHVLFLVQDKKPSELMLHGEDGWSELDIIIPTVYPRLQTLILEFKVGMGSEAPRSRRRDDEYEVKRHMRSCFSRLVAAKTTKVQVITTSNVTIEIV